MYDAKNNLLITIICFLITILIMNWSFVIFNSNKGRKDCFRNKLVYGSENSKNKSMYLFACVDKYDQINHYYVPNDGSAWSDAVDFAEGRLSQQPSHVRTVAKNATWSTSEIVFRTQPKLSGIQCLDTGSIFDELRNTGNINNDDANCFGFGGSNNTENVINLNPSDINAPNFTNNCTKENWYLYKYNPGKRDYIFAVFKRKPFTDTLTCCSNPTAQRNSCNPGYEKIKAESCLTYMQDHCNSGNNITNDYCKKWCDDTDNTGRCDQYKNNYCNNSDNIKNSYGFCSNWCTSKNANCDTGLSKFCDENIENNTLCGCFDKNALNAAPKIWRENPTFTQNRAFCWNKECVTKGVLTNAMKNNIGSCPKCFQAINMLGIEASSVNVSDLTQKCTISDTNNNITNDSPNASIATVNKEIKETPSLKKDEPTSIYDGLTPFQIFILKFVNNIKKIFNI